MMQIFNEAISSFNLPLTIVLGIIAAYWLISLIGLFDFDALDSFLGLDTDVDVEVSGDHGVDIDHGDGHDSHHDTDSGDHSSVGGFFHSVLRILGATDAPIMFVLTVFTLYIWGANILGNIYLNEARSGSVAGWIIIGALVTAFILTKLTVRPLRPLTMALKGSSRPPMVGRSGTVKSLELSEKHGQIEIDGQDGPMIHNARITKGGTTISKGTEVLVISHDKDTNIYLVRSLATED